MLKKVDLYWKAANYLTLAQIYLKDNCLFEKGLTRTDFKEHPNGHWGACPSINFIYAHLQYLLSKHDDLKIQLIIGTGHAGNSLLANLFLEGTLEDYYPEIFVDNNRIKTLCSIQDRVEGMRSEICPFYPGTIYEGGELGYSLATAYGASLDEKEYIYVVIIGDGEMETATLSSSWDCYRASENSFNKVLPIINYNKLKMGSESLSSLKDNKSLTEYFESLGYEIKHIYGNHDYMCDALEWAVNLLTVGKRPLIILDTPKGWTAPIIDGISIENTLRSHKVPVSIHNDQAMNYIEKWLKSYEQNSLFKADGTLKSNIQEILPEKNRRIGNVIHKARKLVSLNLREYALHKPTMISSMCVLEDYLYEMLNNNRDVFKVISPDELLSNKLGKLLNVENGTLEILNENICNAWMQGYNFTGRYSIMISYEAFMPIIQSMVSQTIKYLTQTQNISWRKKLPSFNYLLTSVCWENTYSHQNPEFVNSLMIQHSPFVNVYYPIDANTLLVCTDRCIKSKGLINVITISKHNTAQYLTYCEAINACDEGYVDHNVDEEYDVLFVSIGDYAVLEMKAALSLIRNNYIDEKIKHISIIDLTRIKEIVKSLNNVPMIILFHGYARLIYALLENNENSIVKVLGYKNLSVGSSGLETKLLKNGCSRLDIVEEYKSIRRKYGIDKKSKSDL